MTTVKPRISIVLEESLYNIIKNLAEKEGRSLSAEAKSLLESSLEMREDIYWTKEASERDESFEYDKALSDDEVWS